MSISGNLNSFLRFPETMNTTAQIHAVKRLHDILKSAYQKMPDMTGPIVLRADGYPGRQQALRE